MSSIYHPLFVELIGPPFQSLVIREDMNEGTVRLQVQVGDKFLDEEITPEFYNEIMKAVKS